MWAERMYVKKNTNIFNLFLELGPLGLPERPNRTAERQTRTLGFGACPIHGEQALMFTASRGNDEDNCKASAKHQLTETIAWHGSRWTRETRLKLDT